MGIQVLHNEQKPDVYDILLGGKSGYDPAETPMVNHLEKGPDSPDASLFQFPFDSPDDPTLGGAAEGGDFSQAAATVLGNPDMLHSRMHYWKRFFGVGEVTLKNKGYGEGGEDPHLRQMRLAVRQIMKSMDQCTVSANVGQAGSDSTAFISPGLENVIWDTANIALQTDAQTQVPAAFRPAAAQIKQVTGGTGAYTFAESDHLAIATAIYNSLKANVNMDVWSTAQFKNLVSAWGNLVADVSNYTNVRRYNQNSADKSIIATIDTWTGDTGTFRFRLEPFLRFNTTLQKAEALYLDERWVKYRVRTAPKAENLPVAGGGTRGMASAMQGLQCMPKFLGKVYRAS